MTVNQLIKKLEQVKKDGGGTLRIACDAKELLDRYNGCFDIVDVDSVQLQTINVCDGDGFHIENKDGSERIRTVLLLS